MSNKLADIIKKVNSKPDGLTLINSKSRPDNEDLDKMFEDSNKKHRNWMARLDHLYELVSHPFMVVLILIIVFFIFLIFRYLEIYHTSMLFSQISNDAGTALTYLIAIVGTSIFTKFFERRKK
jgi:polyferredoxin